MIPEKSEHHIDELHELEEQYEADHVIAEKREHHERDVHELHEDLWRPTFHGHEEDDYAEEFSHHYDHADGIDEYLLDEAESETGLKPKQPAKDDPRLRIPKTKATPAHDPRRVDPAETEENVPKYGQAFEHDRKEAIRGSGESAKL